MIKKSHDTTRIDALAKEIIEDEKRHEFVRRMLADDAMDKLKRFLARGSKPERGTPWNR
jgi:hypothetical protein